MGGSRHRARARHLRVGLVGPGARRERSATTPRGSARCPTCPSWATSGRPIGRSSRSRACGPSSSCPLVIDGEPVGGLGFDWITQLAEWTEDDLTLLGMLASSMAQLLGREVAEHELAHRATHDELTGLYNRTGLLEQLHGTLDAAAVPTRVAVVMMDVDRFKVVNDSLGPAVGDELLRSIGARLGTVVRPDDVIARLGGDEFAVVLVNGPGEPDAEAVSERLRAAMSRPVPLRRSLPHADRQLRHRRGARASDRARGAAAPRRRCDVPRQGGGSLPPDHLRRPARGRAGPPPGDGPAAAGGARRRRVRGPLPARARPRVRHDRRCRGAAALAHRRRRCSPPPRSSMSSSRPA